MVTADPFHILAEDIQEPVLQLSASGDLLYMNTPFAQALGYSDRDAMAHLPLGAYLMASDARRSLVQLLLELSDCPLGTTHQLPVVFKNRLGQKHPGTLSCWQSQSPGGEAIWNARALMPDALQPDPRQTGFRSESPERLRYIIDHVPAVIYQSTPTNPRELLFINRRVAHATGYSPEEVMRDLRCLNALIHPEDRPWVEERLMQAMAERAPYLVEYRIVHREGPTIWVYDSGRFIEQEGQLFIEGVLQDITGQKYAEESLIESESRYRSLIGAITDGIILQDPKGKILTCNQAAQDILSLSYSQLAGLRWRDQEWRASDEEGRVVPIDELPFMKTLRTLQPQHQVVLGLRRPRDHRRVWLSINAEPIWSEAGELAGVVSTIADITENKLAKDQLARSESRFRLLFESVSYAIVIVDERGVIMMTNPAAGECFGYDAKELVGKPVATLIPSDVGGNMPGLLREAFQTPLAQGHEPGLRIEIEGRHADGSEIPLDVTLTHLAIHQHRYVLCTMKDISEDRRYIELERAHKKITDSVRYAQRIQMAQLGNYQDIVSAFKDATIFFSPKDIVSGDFYWFTKVQRLHFDEKAMRSETQTLKILVVADCTGHGVPGAFMAALGNAFLHEIVNEHHVIEPHRILSLLDQKIVSTLQNRGAVSMDDGMDMSVLVLDEQQRLLHFAGAKQIMYAVRQRAIEQYKGAPYSLGGKQLERNGQKRFLKETIAIQPGDRYYLASDGFQDQFGRESGRKYLRSNFRKLLLRLADVPMNEQAACFAEELNAWKGLQASQTDDILILGIEV